MRIALPFAAFLLLAQFALAEISVQTFQDRVNIGDDIEIEASVVGDRAMIGFMRFEAVCQDLLLPFYLTPVELRQGFRTQVDPPSLRALSSMEGECTIKTELLDDGNRAIDSAQSKKFTVSNGLRIILLTENLTTLPGQSKKIEGLIRGAGDTSVNADIEFLFGEKRYATSTFNGKFIVILTIPATSRSGTHPIAIIATDNRQNQGSVDSQIEVIAVPSTLNIALLQESQDPGKNLEYTVTILDQAGDIIPKSSQVRIISPDSTYAFQGTSMSAVPAEFAIGQFLPPGEYTLEALHEEIKASSVFVVNEIKDIRVWRDGESIVIENVGNVKFKDEVEIPARSDEKIFTIRKKLALAPGQVERILLSKELQTGTYDIEVPIGMRLSTQTNESDIQALIADDVSVIDSRSPIKKIGSGLGSMTGAVIGADGVLTKNPWYAPIVLFSIIGLIGLYYTRGLWAFMFFGRK